MSMKTYWYKKDLNYVDYYLMVSLIHAIVVKSVKPFILFMLLLAAFILLTRRRFFPFLCKLNISPENVTLTLFGKELCVLPRKRLYRSSIHIGKTPFIVFSSVTMPDQELRTLAALRRQKKAIIYPITDDMKLDFPEWF